MLQWLRKLFGGKQASPQDPPARLPAHPRPRAAYDAAQVWHSNRAAWAGADSMSGRSANSLGVRQTLRSRSRYECSNNGYAGGLIGGLADDTVGTGPRLQVTLEDPRQNEALEKAWCLWAEGEGTDPLLSVGLGGKLHLMAQARPREGESFALLVTNDKLASPVKLDLVVIETDQVTTPFGTPLGPIDGVELDRYGRPAVWHVLREHPGDLGLMTSSGQFVTSLVADRIPVSRMLHWMRPKRAGEVRGVPEITASLPLYAQLRDWTKSTLSAAAIAAKFAGIIKPDLNSPAADASDPDDPIVEVPITDGLLTTLPPGSELKQLEAEHPTTEYAPFKHELIKETGRPVRAPYNKAAGDSSPYNYSSARMDEGDYWSAIKVVRGTCRAQVLDRLFYAWLSEARLISGFLQEAFPDGIPDAIPHTWHWPGKTSIDPLKDAQSDTERLKNGTTTLARIYAEQGLDWEAELRQRAKEFALCRELGIDPLTMGPAGAAPAGRTAPSDMPNYPDDTPPSEGRYRRNGHAANGRAHP